MLFVLRKHRPMIKLECSWQQQQQEQPAVLLHPGLAHSLFRSVGWL
jgi:hypothetical protein